MNRPHEKRKKPWEFSDKKVKYEQFVANELKIQNNKIAAEFGTRAAIGKKRALEKFFIKMDWDYKIPHNLILFELTFHSGEQYFRLYGNPKSIGTGIWDFGRAILHRTGYGIKWKTTEVPDNTLSRLMYRFEDEDILKKIDNKCIIWRKI